MSYKSLNDVQEVISLGKPIEVVDMFLESYLQGIEYEKWAEGKDLTETIVVVVGQDAEGNDITEEQLVNVYTMVDVSVGVAQWKIDNKLEKSYGLDYNGYMVPFRNDDAMAMLQVKAAFEMGLAFTNIEFSNGTVMPIVVADFPAFAAWFVDKRNGYFV
jgi:hypothetical protein